MANLNSVLIECILMEAKGKKDDSGWWLLIQSRGRGEASGRKTFRVELPNGINARANWAPEKGHRLREVGRLEKASRIGAYIMAEHLEVRPGVLA